MELLTVVSLVLVLAHALIVVCTVPPIVFDSTKNSGSWYNQILQAPKAESDLCYFGVEGIIYLIFLRSSELRNKVMKTQRCKILIALWVGRRDHAHPPHLYQIRLPLQLNWTRIPNIIGRSSAKPFCKGVALATAVTKLRPQLTRRWIRWTTETVGRALCHNLEHMPSTPLLASVGMHRAAASWPF